MSRRNIVALLLTAVIAAIIASPQNALAPEAKARKRVKTWALPAGSALDKIKLDARAGWKELEGDEKTPDGVVLENSFLVVVVVPNAPCVRVISKELGTRLDVAVLAEGGKPAGNVAGATLLPPEKPEDRFDKAAVEINAGKASFTVRLGGSVRFVEITSKEGAEAVDLAAAARCAFIPEFFADDVFFDPTLFKRDSIPVPADNMLATVAEDGKSGAVISWTDPAQSVTLGLAGEGAARRFTSTRVTFAKGKVFASVLEDAKGYFFFAPIDDKALTFDKEMEGEKAEEKKFAEVSFDWKPPFAADWSAIIVNAPREGASGAPSRSWPIGTLRRLESEEFGKYMHAAGVKDGKLTLNLEKRFGPYYAVLCVPKERDKKGKTPLQYSALDDVMRQTLGVGPCEPGIGIIGKGVAPCPGSERMREIAKEGDRDRFVDLSAKICDTCSNFVLQAQKCREAAKKAADAAAKAPDAKALAARITELAEEAEKNWAKFNINLRDQVKKDRETKFSVPFNAWPFLKAEDIDKLELSPALYKAISEYDGKLFDEWAAKKDFDGLSNFYGAARTHWTTSGRLAEGAMFKSRRLLMTMRQEAALAAISDPAAAKLAEDVLKITADALSVKRDEKPAK